MRRISLVPAPISYSLASRSRRPGGILVDVAVGTECLDRLGPPSWLAFSAASEDATGGVEARGLAAIGGLGDRVDVGAAAVHRGVHVGDLALHELELADCLAELLAVVHIGHDDVHAGTA